VNDHKREHDADYPGEAASNIQHCPVLSENSPSLLVENLCYVNTESKTLSFFLTVSCPILEKVALPITAFLKKYYVAMIKAKIHI